MKSFCLIEREEKRERVRKLQMCDPSKTFDGDSNPSASQSTPPPPALALTQHLALTRPPRLPSSHVLRVSLKLATLTGFRTGFPSPKFQFGNCKICATGALQIMETFGADLMPHKIVTCREGRGIEWCGEWRIGRLHSQVRAKVLLRNTAENAKFASELFAYLC